MAEQAEESGSTQAKYGTFETDDGDVIIYDRDEPSAWLQSDTVRDVAE